MPAIMEEACGANNVARVGNHAPVQHSRESTPHFDERVAALNDPTLRCDLALLHYVVK